MEVELKLLVDPSSIGAIETHPTFERSAAPRRHHLTTTYFDTPDLALRQHGASLRVRRAGQSFVQTVKFDDPEAALGGRGEWEWPVASAALDFAKLDELPEEVAMVRAAARAAKPVFVTDIERTTWQLDLEGSTSVEAALDSGVARAGHRRADISEIELELKGGPSGPLYRLAIDLADRADLRYGSQSKAERGYGLISADLPPRPERGAIRLKDSASVGDAFPRLLNAALIGVVAEISGTTGGDVESVHRMRAAIRKLRTLLVLFGADLEQEAARRFNASLRALGTILGQGRDWDVFVTETLPRAREATGDGAIDLLVPFAQARRAAAHAAVSEAMRGASPTRLLLGMAAWTSEPGWFAGQDSGQPLRALLPRMLGRLERRVNRRAKHLEGAESEPLHDLRKSMKKLRYSAEDVDSLYAGRSVERYVRALKGALSSLGEINDAAVTITRIDEIAPADRPELAPAAAALLAWNDGRRGKALHKLKAKLHKFKTAESFWS